MFRGGLACMEAISDRITPSGGQGTVNALQITPVQGGAVRTYGRVAHIDLNRGDVLRVITGGGGGWGDAHKREPLLIEQDLRNGFLTEAQASRL